jgi:HEAT repeats
MAHLSWAWLGALMLALTPVRANDIQVEWSRGLLSVKANQQPLSAVLKQIQLRTGIVVKSTEPMSEPVLRGLDQQPLADGLHQLLAKHNHMIVAGNGRQPMRVFVLGGGPSVAGRAPAATAPLTAVLGADPAARVEAVERLADLGDASSLAALRQALTDPDDAVRAVAQQALATLESKPAARSGKSAP